MQSIMQLEYVLFETLFRNISNDNGKTIKRLKKKPSNLAWSGAWCPKTPGTIVGWSSILLGPSVQWAA